MLALSRKVDEEASSGIESECGCCGPTFGRCPVADEFVLESRLRARRTSDGRSWSRDFAFVKRESRA